MSANSQMSFSPKEVHNRLTRTFRSGKTRPIAWRRHQLLQLARMLQDNIKMVEAALMSDLGKPRFEVTVIEITTTIQAAVKAAGLLEEWTAPERPAVAEWRSSWDTVIYHEPKGLVLIISPWNYPFIITLLVLIGAIAAGCPAVLKPSELGPASSGVMAALVEKYLDPDAITVVEGGPDVATKLLELRWDHIFFTGGGKAGRIVAAAAAKNVTPTSLELGGKCPVYVDAECDIELAGRRTLYGKIQNAGQVCVTPDYVLVHKSVRPALEEAVKKAYAEFFPDGPLSPKTEYSKIIDASHFERLVGLIKSTNGNILVGGEDNGTKISPTVVSNVKADDILMQDEIFGPILSIIDVEDVDEAVEFITSRPTPLVLYAFTTSDRTRRKLVERTQSGSLIFNDTFMQLIVDEVPFGGKGESGFGAYFCKDSFDTFTHRRTCINISSAAEPHLALRYQPYTQEAYKIMSAGAHIEIPAA